MRLVLCQFHSLLRFISIVPSVPSFYIYVFFYHHINSRSTHSMEKCLHIIYDWRMFRDREDGEKNNRHGIHRSFVMYRNKNKSNSIRIVWLPKINVHVLVCNDEVSEDEFLLPPFLSHIYSHVACSCFTRALFIIEHTAELLFESYMHQRDLFTIRSPPTAPQNL